MRSGMRLAFDQNAFDDLAWWVSTDSKKAKRIISLIQETAKTPFSGRGKPEPLKHSLSLPVSHKTCWTFEARGGSLRA